MNRKKLIEEIHRKKSFLCVGLDPDITRIPITEGSETSRILEFNKAVIDATRDHCVAYKPNTAFYEMYGAEGWKVLEETVSYIGDKHFIIADAKRGDIGNTSKKYARAFYNSLRADAVTVAPYMGSDSVTPFLEYEGKWVVLLGLTSNKGSEDFQNKRLNTGEYLYERVLKTSSEWGSPENMMYVVGATHPESFAHIRNIVPEHFLLVPGIGSQGGDFDAVCTFGMNEDIGLLINVSRGILYPETHGLPWQAAIEKEAQNYHTMMRRRLGADLTDE